MPDRKALLLRLYKAFNDKDVGALVGGMHADVDWPNFLEGGRIKGREALREYWTRQFQIVSPEASPLELRELADGRVYVRLHYVIRAIDGGGVWTDEMTSNTFTFEQGLVRRMDWGEPEGGELGSPDTLVINLFDALGDRDVDAAGALLHPDANWPNLFGRDRVEGRDNIMSMWAEQISSFQTEVSLLEMTILPDGRRRVRLNYVARNQEGRVFTDENLVATFAFRDGTISRMDWED
ncbi:MAG TPA: nuclear transport factor 2 family protein [Caulobacter sp.]|nr:nuclear transport factor 2 family protein [Caulobacter sp.]